MCWPNWCGRWHSQHLVPDVGAVGTFIRSTFDFQNAAEQIAQIDQVERLEMFASRYQRSFGHEKGMHRLLVIIVPMHAVFGGGCY